MRVKPLTGLPTAPSGPLPALAGFVRGGTAGGPAGGAVAIAALGRVGI
ncbi:hypothetical protein ABC766_04615 [Methylobacterium fujisawaense]